MPVKSRSKTFKRGEPFEDVFKFFDKEMTRFLEWKDTRDPTDYEYIIKKRVTITITYDRDDKTE